MLWLPDDAISSHYVRQITYPDLTVFMFTEPLSAVSHEQRESIESLVFQCILFKHAISDGSRCY